MKGKQAHPLPLRIPREGKRQVQKKRKRGGERWGKGVDVNERFRETLFTFFHIKCQQCDKIQILARKLVVVVTHVNGKPLEEILYMPNTSANVVLLLF